MLQTLMIVLLTYVPVGVMSGRIGKHEDFYFAVPIFAGKFCAVSLVLLQEVTHFEVHHTCTTPFSAPCSSCGLHLLG